MGQTIAGVYQKQGVTRGTPIKICISYPVDVRYLIIYTKKNSLN